MPAIVKVYARRPDENLPKSPLSDFVREIMLLPFA